MYDRESCIEGNSNKNIELFKTFCAKMLPLILEDQFQGNPPASKRMATGTGANGVPSISYDIIPNHKQLFDIHHTFQFPDFPQFFNVSDLYTQFAGII